MYIRDIMSKKVVTLLPDQTFPNYDLLRIYSEQNAILADELTAILDSMYNGAVATNAEGIITMFNKAAERITGIPAADAIGRQVQDIMPNSGLMRVLRTGIPELGQRQELGSCQIVTNRTPVIRDGTVLGALAIFQDITEFETTLAELADVKNLKSILESCLESIYEGIVVVDKDGFITMLNKTYAEILGTEVHLAIGKHCTDVIENTRMHIVAQTGKPEVGDVQQIGQYNVVVMRIPIVKDGEIVGVVGKVMFRDIKDLKSLARKVSALRNEVDYYKEELMKALGGKYTFEQIIGCSEKMTWLKTVAQKAARSSSTVLILGESGTGKELFAHAVHNASPRRNGPFIKVNCAAIPENLLESELFGYEEGAFTGARKGGKPGKFELANGGTIFLDEIGDMTLSMQAKLLRILQEREVERVGGTKTQKIDLRVITATNRDLEDMIAKGEFRQDLYYRLNIISLHIPPLRERIEDIPKLCDALLSKLNSQLHGFVEGISPDAMEIIKLYEWPGNVRELENVLERALNMIDDEVLIMPEHLPAFLKKMAKIPEISGAGKDLDSIISDAEKQAIFKALETCNGNKSKAAQLLGIHRSGFYQKLAKYGIV
jgi:PAS domain S-box-containing protein